MANNNNAPKIDNPKLIDRVIGDIQDGLIDGLPWLNKAFGKAQRLVKIIEGKKYYTPNVYDTGNKYTPVLPDSKIGNFSFFWVDDPQTLVQTDFVSQTTGKIKTNCSLIIWMDLRRVFNSANNRNTESIKADILKLLNGGLWLKNGRFTVNKIYEQSENIYKGFNIDEVDNQFLMHPFAGFRFEGELLINENC